MNSKVVEGKIAGASEYPVLKRASFVACNGFVDYVVLFTGPQKGIVVHVFESPKNDSVKIGWDGGGHFGEPGFKFFDGLIQLSN